MGTFGNALLALVAIFTTVRLVTIAATISAQLFGKTLLMNPIGFLKQFIKKKDQDVFVRIRHPFIKWVMKIGHYSKLKNVFYWMECINFMQNGGNDILPISFVDLLIIRDPFNKYVMPIIMAFNGYGLII